MPSLRHSSAMLSSPRRPAITMRIFSSAEYCRRVARRISRTRLSASSESVSTFDLIVRSFAVKMSSKSSLPQSLTSVQLVLTGNTHALYGSQMQGPMYRLHKKFKFVALFPLVEHAQARHATHQSIHV